MGRSNPEAARASRRREEQGATERQVVAVERSDHEVAETLATAEADRVRALAGAILCRILGLAHSPTAPVPRTSMESPCVARDVQALLEEVIAVGLSDLTDVSPRSRSPLRLAADVLDDPGPWLRAPNAQLGDRRPIDLVGTEEEFRVTNLLVAIDQGLF